MAEKHTTKDAEDVQVENLKINPEEALAAADVGSGEEHAMTIRQACKLYPKAILWAIAMTMTIVMEGYDASMIVSFFAYPSFTQKYGTYDPHTQKYQISSSWMVVLGNMSAFGSVFGLLFNGYVTDKFGHRRVIATNLVFMAGFIFIVFFAPNVQVLCVGQILLGVTWGGMAILGTAYASEVCPLALRGHLTAFTNICWVIGQFVSNGVLDGLVSNPTEWSYRIPFAIQWIWILPLLTVAYFAPESPWWLIRQNRHMDAQKSLQRLSKLSPGQIQAQLQLMIRTDEFERETRTGTSYWDCFRGVNLHRTEVACVVLAAQALDGAAFAYNASYFFTQAGLDSANAYKLQLSGTALAFVGTCLSLYLLSIFGRRTLLMTGLAIIAVDLLVIGVLASVPSHNVLWVESGFAVAWMGIYSSLVGPETFALSAEVSATKLRAQTLSIGRNFYVIVNVVCKVVEPYLINPSEANLKGKTAFVWMGVTILVLIWAVFRLPETRGRTYEELDVLFQERVPVWKFSSTEVDNLGVVERRKEFPIRSD